MNNLFLRKDFCLIAARLLGLAFLLITSTGGAAKIFRVDDFGAKPDGITDSTIAFRQAIEAATAYGGPSIVKLGTGVYFLRCQGPLELGMTCLSIQNAQNLKIVGSDTEIKIANPIAGFIFVTKSSNIVLSDFTLDYEIPPFTQGKVVAVNSSQNTLDVQLDPGMPSLGLSMFTDTLNTSFGMIFNPATRWLKASTNDWLQTTGWSAIDPVTWRIKLSSWNQSDLKTTSVGDLFVQLARGLYPDFYFHQNPGDVSLLRVTAYASPSIFVVGTQNSGNIILRSNRLMIRPGSTRLISSNADAFNLQSNRGQAIIENNVIAAIADDVLNIGADGFKIINQVGNSYQLETAEDLRAGDSLQFVNQNLQVEGTATINSVTSDGVTSTVTVDSTVAASIGSSVFDWNMSAPGSLFQNNTVLFNRGVLRLNSSSGSVQYNYFSTPVSAGIVFGSDLTWKTGPISGLDRFQLSDNVVEAHSTSASMAIFATAGKPQTGSLPALGTASLHPFVFNWYYYVQTNPDLSNMNQDQATQHWLQNGQFEGRSAAPGFVSREYLATYPDLLSAFGPTGYAAAVSHYVTNGRSEGRSFRTSPLPAANYRLPLGGIFYDNGQSANCFYSTWERYIAHGGSPALNGVYPIIFLPEGEGGSCD